MPKPSPSNGNGKRRFSCPYYKSRPHNMSQRLLCAGYGPWPMCSYFSLCMYLPVHEQPVQLPKEITEDE